MSARIYAFTLGFLFFLPLAISVHGNEIELFLGDKPSLGLFQPRVDATFYDADGNNLGPTSSGFVLDTAANSLLVYQPAVGQISGRIAEISETKSGLEREGIYEEFGLSGSTDFDVSPQFEFEFADTAGSTQTIEDVRFMYADAQIDPTNTLNINGVLGMTAMNGRVVTLDNTSRDGAPAFSMTVTFEDDVPRAPTHRLGVPVSLLTFEQTGSIEGALPVWSSGLPTVPLNLDNDGNRSTVAAIFDTGAQTTIISSQLAFDLGLDTDGDGDLLDEATATVEAGGATGSVDVPVLRVEELSIPTDRGFALTMSNAEVLVADIDESITVVLASDFFSGDGGLDLGGGLGDLGDLLGGGGLGDLGDLLGGGGLGDLGDLLGGGGLGDLGDLLGGGGLGDLGDLFGDGGLGDLLGELLGGGGGDLSAQFPLESVFDRVHLDFRELDGGNAMIYFDLTESISSTILNGDHLFNVDDIDDMTAALGTDEIAFDLNNDGEVDITDRTLLIRDVMNTVEGDVDLDGDVDVQDFLALSRSFGRSNLGWAGADFDGDGSTEVSDFLSLSRNFGFGTGTQTQAVPEPSGLLLAFGCFVMLIGRRKRRS